MEENAPGTNLVACLLIGLGLAAFQGFNQLGDELQVTVSPDGRAVAIARATKTFALGQKLRLRNLTDGRVLRDLDGHGYLNWVASSIHAVAFHPSGSILASGGMDGRIKFWTTNDGKCAGSVRAHDGRIVSLAFAPDGRSLASGGAGQVRLWRLGIQGDRLDVTAAAPPTTIPGGWAWSLRYSPDGKMLAAAMGDLFGAESLVRIYDGATGAELRANRVLGGPGMGLASVSFRPDGKVVATGGRDGRVRFWDIESGQQIAEHRFEGQVWDLAYAPGGASLAVACVDDRVRFLDTATDAVRTSEPAHFNVLSVSFSPDGHFLVSGGGGFLRKGRTALWDVAAGRPLWVQ